MEKRFTGCAVILKDFPRLEEARKWIGGDAQKKKATPGTMGDLKEKAGMAPAEAIKFAIRHAQPSAGILSVSQSIEAALAAKSKSRRSSSDSGLA